jgi:hypothetical protein
VACCCCCCCVWPGPLFANGWKYVKKDPLLRCTFERGSATL